MIQCFILDEDSVENTIAAIGRSAFQWIAAISPRAMWAQIDWYPRLIQVINDGQFDLIVPVVNNPAPAWQRTGSIDTPDMVLQRKHAKTMSGTVIDVTREHERAAPVAAVMSKDNAPDFLVAGLSEVHERAAQFGRVCLARSVYVVQA